MEPRPFDTIVKAKKPFSWYDLQGADNAKFKCKVATSVGQSDDPSVVGLESTIEPSTVPIPSTIAKPSTE